MEEMDLTGVGMRLRAFREAKQITQKELGLRVGFSRSYVAGTEAGTIRPSMDALSRMAEYLGTTLSALVEPKEGDDKAPISVDTVVSVQRVSGILVSVNTLRDLPGYDSGVYDRMESDLAQEMADLLGVEVESLYEPGGPLYVEIENALEDVAEEPEKEEESVLFDPFGIFSSDKKKPEPKPEETKEPDTKRYLGRAIFLGPRYAARKRREEQERIEREKIEKGKK